MAITYFNVFPANCTLTIREFNEEFINKLVTQTEVEIDQSFDPNYVIPILMLYQANVLLESLNFIGIKTHVGIHCETACHEEKWNLVIDTLGNKAPIGQIVNKFFIWDSIVSRPSIPSNQQKNN